MNCSGIIFRLKLTSYNLSFLAFCVIENATNYPKIYRAAACTKCLCVRDVITPRWRHVNARTPDARSQPSSFSLSFFFIFFTAAAATAEFVFLRLFPWRKVFTQKINFNFRVRFILVVSAEHVELIESGKNVSRFNFYLPWFSCSLRFLSSKCPKLLNNFQLFPFLYNFLSRFKPITFALKLYLISKIESISTVKVAETLSITIAALA